MESPELQRGRLRYPNSQAGATVRAWGPFRVPLYPSERSHNGVVRNGFYLHIDVGNDGTAGCIGIHPGDETKFNNVMSLLGQRGQSLPVIVSYS